MRSMTGFGMAERLIDGFNIKVQIKSVNHRYFDCSVKTPRYYTFLEEKIRALAAGCISRGKVEIYTSIEQKEQDDREIRLNAPVAQGYINALGELESLGVKNDVTASVLARFSDIFKIEYKDIDEDAISAMVKTVFEDAAAEFLNMRAAEGERLKTALCASLDRVTELVGEVERRSPESVAQYREKMEQRIRELLDGAEVDETRLLTEAAIFADKTCVDEETVRLKSHVGEFRTAIESSKPVGKKLDFIVQEMNREANTIGSKANDFENAKYVVELKSEIEKIREQIQNIE